MKSVFSQVIHRTPIKRGDDDDHSNEDTQQQTQQQQLQDFQVENHGHIIGGSSQNLSKMVVDDGILYVNNKPLNQNKLLPVEIYNLEDLDTDTLEKIFGDDTVWLVDQSPTSSDGTGSTLYMINKNGVTKKILSNAFMQETTNDNKKTFKKLHWLAKPDTYLSSENYSKNLIVGCWVGSGVTTIFDQDGNVLDNYCDDNDIKDGYTATHAAYFIELDTTTTDDNLDVNNSARVLIANMSNTTIISVGITKDYKFDGANAIRFNITDYVKTLDSNTKALFADPIKPITARAILNIPLNPSYYFIIKNYAGITLSSGGFLIVSYTSSTITVEKLYTPDIMPSAGLLSYSTSVNDNYSIYVNHGVGTGSTSSSSHSALYKIDYEPNPNYNVYDDSIKYFPVTFNDAEIIYRKNSGDAHGIVETSDKYLSVVDRDLNGITIVSFDDQTVNNNIVHYVEDRDIAMDLIDIGAENYDIENGVKYRNLYTSNRGSVPVSGNNSQINNAVGSQGGMSVIKSINNGKNVDLTYILNISNNSDSTTRYIKKRDHSDSDPDSADAHAILVL